MEFVDLQYFVSIAETGSFTKSALQNNVAQSALSRRVRDIETEMGTALFYRNGRGVVLTEAGETFLTAARAMLAQRESLRQEMRRAAGELDGTVKLAVPPSVGLVLLAPLLRQIRTDHPRIRMRVLEGFSGHVADWLAAGKVDLAVLYKMKASALLGAEHLLFEDMFLISALDAPRVGGADSVRMADLATEELVLLGVPHGLRVLVEDAAARAGVTLNVAMEVETLPTIYDLVRTGGLRTVLPLAAVKQEVTEGRLIAQRITDPLISRELILAHAPHRAAAPVTKAVVKLIRSKISELVRSGVWDGRL
ncbi:LysR family transcriptional regulator [Paracoccus subflavus]|uniref:LysR family transcriptional regulator n=1 Tax=Paracoccus subflavus TaxID=2528244 RepID=A0A4Q9G440_9RHOB|nr:LysR family transcriptional regulator [Paracoccus subflavus]TBN42730.1 LysR family transcriptional regulator [Paracoccus subflavus]